jgi:hypothetical protein
MLGNKWVKISIYSLIILLIFWVLYLLVKRLFEAAFVPTPEELSEEAIENLPPNPEQPDAGISDEEALIIADGLENAMKGGGTTCLSMFKMIEPWKEDGNSLRKIYSAFGKRSGWMQSGKYDLFEWFRGDLSNNCINYDGLGGIIKIVYPCDVPDECSWDELNLNELACMRHYWEASGLSF